MEILWLRGLLIATVIPMREGLHEGCVGLPAVVFST